MTDAVTFEALPVLIAEEFADGELLIMPQSISIAELPPMFRPVFEALFSSATTQYSSDPGTLAAVDRAIIVGDAFMNIELNGSGFVTASTTRTWSSRSPLSAARAHMYSTIPTKIALSEYLPLAAC